MTSISHIQTPRLNWDDRSIEYYIALEKFKMQASNDQDNKANLQLPNFDN